MGWGMTVEGTDREEKNVLLSLEDENVLHFVV